MSAHDKIATRLSQIIIRLNNGERLKISDLADEFGVDKRTIQRDLVRLNALPIERENDLFFIADYALGKLGFKDIKNFAILSGIKGLYPSLDNAFLTDILNEKLNHAYLIKNQDFGEI
ncbi:HTH domain-containing protein, partial [Campylobacter gastrosuis]